jgi:hypothetical protein
VSRPARAAPAQRHLSAGGRGDLAGRHRLLEQLAVAHVEGPDAHPRHDHQRCSRGGGRGKEVPLGQRLCR